MTPRTVLDVSRWQGRIDWDKVHASGQIDGVMLRALGTRNGRPYLDPFFETNYAACARLGIPAGAYAYTTARTSAAQDEELSLLHQALRGKQFRMPVALDVEDPGLRNLSPDSLTTLAARGAAELERWGLYAMI